MSALLAYLCSSRKQCLGGSPTFFERSAAVVMFLHSRALWTRMKLKERLLAAGLGFGVAIVLILVLETLELSVHIKRSGGGGSEHGIIKAQQQTSSVKTFMQRNLQKTDSSGNSGQQQGGNNYPSEEKKVDLPNAAKPEIKASASIS